MLSPNSSFLLPPLQIHYPWSCSFCGQCFSHSTSELTDPSTHGLLPTWLFPSALASLQPLHSVMFQPEELLTLDKAAAHWVDHGPKSQGFQFTKYFDRLLTQISSNGGEIQEQALKMIITAYHACKGNKHFLKMTLQLYSVSQ